MNSDRLGKYTGCNDLTNRHPSLTHPSLSHPQKVLCCRDCSARAGTHTAIRSARSVFRIGALPSSKALLQIGVTPADWGGPQPGHDSHYTSRAYRAMPAQAGAGVRDAADAVFSRMVPNVDRVSAVSPNAVIDPGRVCI